MPKLEFDINRHEYSIDGVIIPGYSKIAKDFGLIDYSNVRPADLEWKAQVGKAVHTAILFDNAGELDMDSLDEVVSSYFKSWLIFKKLYQPKILIEYSEKPVWSIKWKYGVIPDILAEINKLSTIVEIKTVSQMNKVTALQTAAQKIAVEEMYKLKIKQRWGLQLIPNAQPKLEPYADMSDEAAWVSFVNAWHYKERTGLWKQ
jgi:hypothetical protein